MSLQCFLQFLFLLYISTNRFYASPASAESESSVAHFEMYHRHHPEILGGRNLSRAERTAELVHGDKVRMEMITHKLRLKRKLGATSSSRRKAYQVRPSIYAKDNSSFSLPMMSGFYAQSATYYVPFRVGTPAQTFLLVVDTGSDLTWVNCKRGSNNQSQSQSQSNQTTTTIAGEAELRSFGDDDKTNKTNGPRIFHADRSETFKTIPCATRMCQQSLSALMAIPECPSPKAPCSYFYNYSEASAKGVFAYDSVTVNLANGNKKKIPGMLIGCTEDWLKPDAIGLGNADGIFGLAFNTHAFVFNVFKAFRGKFSYCLMDHTSPKQVYNYLTFGHRSEEEMPPNMQYADMGLIEDWYALHVDGIYVDGVKLDIPEELWTLEEGRGLIIDTGFSLTTFAEDAYTPIMAALEKPLIERFPRVEYPGFLSCFDTSNTNRSTNNKVEEEPFFDESLVPKFEMEFTSGVRFKPPVKSYFIDVAHNGIRCFGFLPSVDEDSRYLSVLGNIMQQNHLWEYNSFRSQVGIAPSTCVLRHHHKF